MKQRRNTAMRALANTLAVSPLPCTKRAEMVCAPLPATTCGWVTRLWAQQTVRLCPGPLDGTIEALCQFGLAQMKPSHILQPVSGTWTDPMTLTDAQTGGGPAVRQSWTQGQADGTRRIGYAKIFITCGEQEMADKIIHLVPSDGALGPRSSIGQSPDDSVLYVSHGEGDWPLAVSRDIDGAALLLDAVI